MKLNFRDARKRAGLTMEEAAKLIGVSRVTIWLWETGRGNPNFSKLKKIAEVYGCPMADLVREETA